MTDMPERVRLDPDHDGWEDQVVGWDADRTDDQGRPHAPEDWPVYTREEAANARDAKLVEALRKYGRHDGLCGIVGGYGYCTCGLDAAKKELGYE